MRTSRVLPYLVLLQAGFTVPRAVASRAVRSYRTFSPLPTEAGGLFSVALSVGSRPPGVTWRPVRRSPDFPLRLNELQRLPGPLRHFRPRFYSNNFAGTLFAPQPMIVGGLMLDRSKAQRSEP